MNQIAALLDLRTIVLVSVIIYFMCSTLLVLLWRRYRHQFDGLNFLALSSSLQTAGLLALGVRGLMPESLSIFLTNGFIVLGALSSFHGFMLFCGKPHRMVLWFVMMVIFLLAQAYWYYMEPSLMWRTINASMMIVVTSLLTAYVLFTQDNPVIRSFTIFAAWVLILYAGLFSARIVVALYEHRTAVGFFGSKTIEAWLGVFYPALFVLMTYAVSLMINLRLSWETDEARKELKTLSGLLPICAHCKKVRDDRGYWNQIETYVSMHSEADFSHGICPECEQVHYTEIKSHREANI